ncbi:MAG: 3-hydroxyisobutyryl-CoA hydrolase [Hyphomicrobiales bacterium]|nr:MAG: 3-hydroxyisobutyryl-CoA hydrolase [Hyphomicrobiales bacterium]
MTTDEILFERRGRTGFVTLNRPQALNALTHGMASALQAQLDEWRNDPEIGHVVVAGAGDKAFCAGGDIRHIYEQGIAGDPHQIDFFRDEYRLNVDIKHYPKPYIALIDGIVMGGGVGVSVNGSHRVGGDNIGFAMPEVGIGFFPDVGGTYFLPRMPGETGLYCGLTGARLKQADAQWSGVTTHALPSARFPELIEALESSTDVDATLDAFASDPGPAPLAAMQPVIDETFGSSNVGEILKRLDDMTGEHAEWAAKTAKTIRKKSPTSIEIAYHQLRRGAKLDFDHCMQLEFRIVSRVLKGHDFYEGIRATIIDKDNTPRWRPADFEQIEVVDIDGHFAVLPDGDLTFPARD